MRKLPIILALTAIPSSIVIGILMRYVNCSEISIFFAISGQAFCQFIVAGILAEQKNCEKTYPLLPKTH